MHVWQRNIPKSCTKDIQRGQILVTKKIRKLYYYLRIMQFPTPIEIQQRKYILTGFIDPGGSIDDYFFTVLKTHIPTAHIQIIGASLFLLRFLFFLCI